MRLIDGRTVFLDMDGVLVDNRGPLQRAYRMGVGEGLQARFGGDLAAWMEAQERAYRNSAPAPLHLGPAEAYRWEDIAGVRGPCELMGVTPPSDEECAELGRAWDWRVRAELCELLPDAEEGVRALAGTNQVHIASGNAAWVVEVILERLGVRGLVGLPCGADLLGVRKGTPGYYPALFALAGVEAEEAVVVDDSVGPLQTASALGARTALRWHEGNAEEMRHAAGVDVVVGSLGEVLEAQTNDRG